MPGCARLSLPGMPWHIIFSLGLAYIAAAVSKAGYVIDVADFCFGRHPLDELCAQVTRFQPNVIGLSLRNVDNAAYPLTVDYLALHREVVDALHAASNAPVVLGGSGFSILPEAYMRELDGDWGVAGEGERTFVALLRALEHGLDPSIIAGVVSPAAKAKNSPSLPVQPQRPQNWGEEQHPLRNPFNYARYIRRGGTGNIQTRRGCVFKCSYCTYPLLEGNHFRARDAADVVDEIEKLQQDYGPHPIFFVDSILNFPRGHVEAICEEILQRKLNLRWSCYATPIKLDRHQAQLMAAAGCEGIELGTDAVDSGFLPGFLQQQAHETGNWVLSGLVDPIQPVNQRLLRRLGIAGPLWQLFHKPWIQWFYRSNLKRPNTSWGVPNASKKIVD